MPSGLQESFPHILTKSDEDMRAEEFILSNVFVGDDDTMYVTEKDAMDAISMACEDIVKKWTLWCFNFRTPFEATICKIWGGTLSGFGGRYYCEDNHFTQHLIEKWQSFENRGDARMLFFYCELDSGLQKQLVAWVMENYRG